MATAPEHGRIFEFGPFRLDPSERLCLRNGQPVSLTPKAFDLLVYLVERHGHLVEKQALIHALWPDSVVEEANLAYTVSALRKVLDDGEDGASVIQTVPTRGYRFVAPVKTSRRIQADPATDREAIQGGPLEGDTLAARLRRGCLPLNQVLRVGIDIAEALEAAHRQGIVHGELAPSNVMLTAAGTTLLKSGLSQTNASDGMAPVSTAARTATDDRMILDTLAYMAPEQVRGLGTDARTDLFALGTILFEMATGRRAFEAATEASLTKEILETEPPAASTLAPQVPPALDHVIQVCLAKDPADRWQTAHDLKLQLQWIQAQDRVEASTVPAAASLRRMAWIPWAVAAAAFAALAGTTLMLSSRPLASPALPARFDLILPSEIRRENHNAGVISPDGQRFVFEAIVDGRQQLVLRNMASTALVVVTGTEGGFAPFWSPDSRSVAFFHADGHLVKQVLLPGGPVRVIADTKYAFGGETGGTWRNGVILLSAQDGRIYRVAATGGTPTALETLPWKPGQKHFVFPRFLPDGRHFLVSVVGDPALYVSSLDAVGTRKIIEDGASAVYAAGHLFYSRGAGVFARPFDPRRLEFSGAEVQVTEQAGAVSVADDGTIVYRSEDESISRLTWFDRSGKRTGTLGEPRPYHQVVLSPRGRHATVVLGDAQAVLMTTPNRAVNAWDLWDADLASGIFSRLTNHPAHDSDPSWSPDERALAFTSWRTGRAAVFVKDLTSGQEDLLVPFDERVAVDQWTPDGRFIIFRTFGRAVYAMPLRGDRTPRMLADTPFIEDEVHVSPDARWVAFHADESGRWEVYVAAFPAFTSKRQISSGGGVQPQWRADGRELFYLGPDGSLMSVRVDAATEFTASPPARLFTTNIAPDPYAPQYAVTPDGQRFLGLDRAEGTRNFTVLLNWLNRPAAGAP
jgi:DNA-binding winged helix-turn-helix (wHTH) protein/Tol biopolymer transport system component